MNLFASISDNNIDTLKLLLARGVDVNGRNDSDETPLLVAAGAGSAPMVDVLLEAGTDTHAVNAYGCSALGNDVHQSQTLAWAASSGHQAVVEILIDIGNNIAHKTDHGLTASDLARDNGFPDLANRLAL